MIRIEPGDCTEVMARLKAEGVQVDSVVCDPPYHLTSGGASKGFMGKVWDGGDVAFQPDTWRLAFDLLKPGGHLVAFSGTRTYHRMAAAIEDAGFEIRDQIAWVYGSGFAKSRDPWRLEMKLKVEAALRAQGVTGEIEWK